MTASSYRAARQSPDEVPAQRDDAPLELSADLALPATGSFDSGTWEDAQREQRGHGGRQVLGWALVALSVLWIGFTAWSAGSALGAEASAPMVAQWVAIAAGPLALIGLAWLVFGRTRRKESERFTQSVVAMRSEARSLEALLDVLSQRLEDSRSSLSGMTEQLMGLGDRATGRFDALTREFDASGARLAAHGAALDRTAESARNDIAVLLDDLPRAEQSVRQVAEQMRAIGADSTASADAFGSQASRLADIATQSEAALSAASERIAARAVEVEQAATSATARLGESEQGMSNALATLLGRTSAMLEEIRSGIDVQSAAVTALVAQSAAGIARAGTDSAEALATNVTRASSVLDGLAGRVAEQERASQRMIADIDRGLVLIDTKFAELASQGDQRAAQFLESLTRARGALDGLAAEAASQDGAILGLSDRTATLRDHIDQLVTDIRDRLSVVIGEAHGGTEQLAERAQAVRPDIEALRDAAVEAGDKVADTGSQLAEQQQRLTVLLTTLDDGVGDAQSKLVGLTASITQTQAEAAALTAQTGPALVAALVQVREAAQHAAERAREAIDSAIPDAAGKLSDQARAALERVIEESIIAQLRDVDQVAARAVEAARGASDRLSAQMLNIGQSAAALEAHVEKTNRDQREKDSEAFAKRVALLIDSMNSASIDVGKILSDEVDDKAWEAYLKGDRGVFTRRAVRLLDGGETRAIRSYYDGDAEFQASVNRYVHDFEAMLRRVLAERDGGMIAVTLMSSDMGKLYAALGEAIDRRR